MDPARDLPGESTCTTCSFSEDFSNYWTAVLYFRARNGTFKRVPQTSQINGAQAGITVYYMQDALYDTTQKSKVTSFKPVGHEDWTYLPLYRGFILSDDTIRASACSSGMSTHAAERKFSNSDSLPTPAWRTQGHEHPRHLVCSASHLSPRAWARYGHWY